MNPRNASELKIVCASALIAIAIVVTGVAVLAHESFDLVATGLVVSAAAGAGIVAWARAFGAKRTAKAELTSGEQYRGLADEYRRLADLAVTAQEHTDLKLGDVGVQLDYLREKIESMQKILEDVE